MEVSALLFVEICKLKKFNYTKIDKSTVLRLGSNLKMAYACADFSIIEFFFIYLNVKIIA